MPRRRRSGVLLWCALAATSTVLSVGQDDATVDPASILAEIGELSESFNYFMDDEKKAAISAMIGNAMGNWKTGEAFEALLGKADKTCTIKRLGASEHLSREFFDAATEPLVFRSSEVDKWKALTYPWTRQWLRDTYGRSEVVPRSQQVLAHMIPNRKDNGGTLALKQFAILDTNRSIFDRSWLNASSFEEEDDLLLVDELWDDGEWAIPSFFKNHTEERGMEMGPTGHGFPFHQQGEMWQVQTIGKKLWMVHPPRGLPENWENAHPRKVFAKALAKEGCPMMQHCLVEPGDVIFVPRFWYHGTLNVGDSIGFGGCRDPWNIPDEEVLALAAIERNLKKDQNALVLDMAAVKHAENKSWKDALKDSKAAHLARPGDPYIARRFAELLLAVSKNTSALQVVDKYINRTLTLHEAGWMDKQEMSGILTLVAHPIVANNFGGFQDVQRLVPKAMSLVKKAAKMDPLNWAPRLMAAHHYLLLGNLEKSFEIVTNIGTKSMAYSAAQSLLGEMCYDMPEQYKDLQQKYCPEQEQEDAEEEGAGAEEGSEQ